MSVLIIVNLAFPFFSELEPFLKLVCLDRVVEQLETAQVNVYHSVAKLADLVKFLESWICVMLNLIEAVQLTLLINLLHDMVRLSCAQLYIV